jgi:hypothetical protein
LHECRARLDRRVSTADWKHLPFGHLGFVEVADLRDGRLCASVTGLVSIPASASFFRSRSMASSNEDFMGLSSDMLVG